MISLQYDVEYTDNKSENKQMRLQQILLLKDTINKMKRKSTVNENISLSFLFKKK